MRHPSHPTQRSPKSPKEWDAAQCLLSSLDRKCRSACSLNLSGSSQFHFLEKSLLSQLNSHFFQSQSLWDNGAHVNYFTLCLNFNVLNKTFN